MAELNREEGVFKIQDFWLVIISKWYWIPICLIISLFIAILFIKKVSPIYIRKASLVIKDDSKIPSMNNNTSIGLEIFKSSVNIDNEILTLQAPALMIEVINNLHLNEKYVIKSGLQNVDLYKRSPIHVELMKRDIYPFSFSITPVDNNYVLINDITHKERVFNNFKVEFGDTVNCQYGRFTVNKTPNFDLKQYQGNEIQFNYLNQLSMAMTINSHLKVELGDEDATFINMTLTDVSYKRAEDILNGLIKVYNEDWIKNKNQVAIASTKFINERLLSLKNDLYVVDSDIAKFKSENLIPDVESVSKLYMTQSCANQSKILELNNQLLIAKYIKKFLADNLKDNQLLPMDTGLENTNVGNQIADYNALILQSNTLIANSSKTNPVVVDVLQSLSSMKQAIVKSIDNFIVTGNAQLKEFNKAESFTNMEIARSPKQAKYLLAIERQQKVMQELYLFLLQKREENQLSLAFSAYNTHIVNPPYGTKIPIFPKKMQILMLAVLLGIFVPIIILYLSQVLDTKLRGRKDLEGILTIPFIGEIPIFKSKRRRYFTFRKKSQLQLSEIVIKEGDRNYINEAFRIVRTNLDFMQTRTNSNQVVMFTSFTMGSGKTFTSINLAMSMAIRKKKVIIIDLDIRKAALTHSIEPSKNIRVGISHYLREQIDDYHKIIVKGRIHPNLDYIPSGMLPPNPTELLLTDRLAELLRGLRNEYDYIYLDCPSINLVADSTIINKLVDLTAFVIRVGNLDRNLLPVLEDIYKKNKLKNMALILNGVPHFFGCYGYGYGYGAKDNNFEN